MNLELIDDATLEAIPDDDPGYAFVLFERACRISLLEAISATESSHLDQSLRLDYLHDVVAAAQHFDIPELKDFQLPHSGKFDYDAFEDFSRRVRFFSTHFRLTAKATRGNYSVELQGSHKDRIRTLVSHLKEAIDRSDLASGRKSILQRRILDFEKALEGKRLKFADAMMCLSLLGAGLYGVGEGAEGLSKLVHEITVAIGQSKEAEDSKIQLLPRPPLKPPVYLLQVTTDTGASGGTNKSRELDDEIPF